MSYPQHEYSKYIDNQMSFSNKVSYPPKTELVDALKNARCSGGIMLEPRLQEYLKKKKYYKENNIKPCISLESEFQITNMDRRVLRAFLRGARDMYKPKKLAFAEFNKDIPKKKQHFPSKSFRDGDKRVQKFKKQDLSTPINRGMFIPDGPHNSYYEDPIEPMDRILDARDLRTVRGQELLEKQIRGFNLDDTRFDPRSDPMMDPGYEEFNKHQSQYRINANPDPDPRNNYIISDLSKKMNKDKRSKKSNHYHGSNSFESSYQGMGSIDPLPNVQNMDRCFSEYDGDTKPTDQILNHDGEYDSRYGKFDKPDFSEKSDMDLNNHMVIPKMSSNDRRGLSTFDYKMEPFIGQKKPIRDAEFETNLVRGMPSHTTKSYGYRNPKEHYFHYIEDDFQNQENSVEMFGPRGGASTRCDNKKLAKQKYTREIM